MKKEKDQEGKLRDEIPGGLLGDQEPKERALIPQEPPKEDQDQEPRPNPKDTVEEEYPG